VIAICFDAMCSSRTYCGFAERKREKRKNKKRETCVYVAALFDHIKFINPPLARRKARRGVQKVTACRLWQPLQRVYFPDAGRISVYERRGGGGNAVQIIYGKHKSR